MKLKRKSDSDNLPKRPFKKQENVDPDKRHPNPNDPNEETGPPIKEMPIKNKPHRE